MLVIDASVLAVALLDDGQDGDTTRQRLRGESLAAPALIDLEVLSVWRGLSRGGQLDTRRVALALEDLQSLPMQRVDHAPLLERCWQLRENLTVYDAAYVALAEVLQATLVTGDRRLARASGPRCAIEVVNAQE
ncbi:MAG TPA: type II toxin-antitoxin system VapC family toxin [Intrasporangium sp.]|uniref:type II toxin-antitoxin system VapC family toxin n=1 Tax=Intrasporangium sp. TaxID=1925024 RepID=UPI002B4AA0CD|nr:type II toxin-antitoxin system VapC family toxin [Intrasporangium sp.]HKX67809.1 type II toxin-antitoxin system VapC family toxin [Intrasporangium sp.]